MRRPALVAMGVLFILAACSGDEERPAGGAPRSIEEGSMRLTSTAFEHEGDIPARHTCDGADVSPALTIEEVPAGAASLALVMDDPDAPRGTWDHWVAYDIPTDAQLPEGVGTVGTPGTNSWGRTGYGGPCPPSGTHRYFFVVYALDTELGLEPGVDKATLLRELEGHVLAEATLMGRYRRS